MAASSGVRPGAVGHRGAGLFHVDDAAARRLWVGVIALAVRDLEDPAEAAAAREFLASGSAAWILQGLGWAPGTARRALDAVLARP